MKEKIESATEFINMVNREYKNPIIYSAMGKDSLPLVHLCRKLGFDWEIMFHREHFFPRKYRYANKMIDMWNLRCRDYPPRECQVFYFNNTFEVTRNYAVGFGDMSLCAMLYKPEHFINGEYLCALKDIYLQPKVESYGYKWDIGLMSHRRTERKPHGGMQQNGLLWTIKHNIGSADFVYPMWDWTDEDMYQYHVDNDIPINFDVYEIKDGTLVPKIDLATGEIDSTYNTDRRPACFECMKPDNPPTVFCPKKMCFTNNCYDSLVKASMPVDFPLTTADKMYSGEWWKNKAMEG